MPNTCPSRTEKGRDRTPMSFHSIRFGEADFAALTEFIRKKGEALVPSIAAARFGTSPGVVKNIYLNLRRTTTQRGSSTQRNTK